MSVYSTPLLIYDESSSDESVFFTPQVSFSCITPRRKKRKKNHIFNVPSSEMSTSNLLLSGRKISSLERTTKTDECGTSKFSIENESFVNSFLIDTTPKRCRSTPLRCISNQVTPAELNSSVMKFQDRIAKYDKENQSQQYTNNSCEITSISNTNISDFNAPIQLKSKNKPSFLQKLGIRRRPKENRKTHKKSFRSFNDSEKIILKENAIQAKNYGTCINTKSGEYQNKDISGNVLETSAIIGEKSTSSGSLLIQNESFKSLFSRNRKSVHDKAETKSQLIPSNSEHQCRCSASTVLSEELAHKIISKLNLLEEELKEIKSVMKNRSVSAVINSIPPPPPPPPLPNSLLNQSTGALKRKIDLTTPENEQVIKRQSRVNEQKTHFSITVEDIKSVKLRKTPATINAKRPSTVTSSSVTGVKDGVLRSVKFKATKKNAFSKKDLSHIVNEILSPSKRDGNVVSNSSVSDKNENGDHEKTLITETTPIKFKNRNVKFRSTKRKDLSLESPVGKRQNSRFGSSSIRGCFLDNAE